MDSIYPELHFTEAKISVIGLIEENSQEQKFTVQIRFM